MQRVAVGYLAGAVIFKSPTDRGGQHQQGAEREGKTVFRLYRKQDARQRNQGNGYPQPPSDGFVKHRESDDGRCHNLEIVEKGSIGGWGELQSEHQQDGCGDIQCDHSDRITQILTAQRLFVALATQGGEDYHSGSRTQIEESRQHCRRNFFQQELREWHTEGIQGCRQYGMEYGFVIFAGHNRDVSIGCEDRKNRGTGQGLFPYRLLHPRQQSGNVQMLRTLRQSLAASDTRGCRVAALYG